MEGARVSALPALGPPAVVACRPGQGPGLPAPPPSEEPERNQTSRCPGPAAIDRPSPPARGASKLGLGCAPTRRRHRLGDQGWM